MLTLTAGAITALGAGTALAAKEYPARNIIYSTMSSPNYVANNFANVVHNAEHATVVTGMAVYRGSAAVTEATVQTSEATAHGTAVTAQAAWGGMAFVGRIIGAGFLFTVRGVASIVVFTVKGVGAITLFTIKGIASAGLFVLRMPGKIIGSVTRGPTVHALIQPTDDREGQVIDSETSAAILTRFNAEQKAKIEARLAEQVAANEKLAGTVVAGDSQRGGYPAKWDAPVAQDSLVDSWGMYNRECVSYAAWKVYQTFGNMPNWGGIGNANQWPGNAQRAGIATGSTPQVHSVAISMRGYYGHAMWVEKVSGDMVYVSQYNYDLHGNYSEMWVNANQFTYIYFK